MATTTTTIAPLRGEGLVYTGSLVEHFGTPVRWVDDCDCGPCAELDPWSSVRRYTVRLVTGETLVHARPSSLSGR